MKALMAFFREGDSVDNKPAYKLAVEKLKEAGASGVTVIKGYFGFGKHKGSSEPDPFHGYGDKPVIILVIDDDSIIEKVANVMKEIKEDIFMITWTVERA